MILLCTTVLYPRSTVVNVPAYHPNNALGLSVILLLHLHILLYRKSGCVTVSDSNMLGNLSISITITQI